MQRVFDNPYVDERGSACSGAIADAVRLAETHIRRDLTESPILLARGLDPSGELVLKLENQQPTGSFKVRGVANRVLGLTQDQRARGIVAASTGNHGLGVARVAERTGTSAVVFVPRNTSTVLTAAIKRDRVEVRQVGSECSESEFAARTWAEREGSFYVAPYNDPAIIAGQGTLAVELLRQVPNLGRIYLAVGGGGLIAGVAGFLRECAPAVDVVGCSPSASCAMHASVAAAEIVDVIHADTLSRGTAGGVEPNSITFPLCRDLVDRWELVSEAEIAHSIVGLIDRERITPEGAAAVALAAWRRDTKLSDGRKACVVVCGGNLDVGDLRHARAQAQE